MPLVLSGDGITSDNITSLAASKLTGQVQRANAVSGSVIQTIFTYVGDATQISSTSTSWVSSGISATITPTSASNRIVIEWSQSMSDKVSASAMIMTMFMNGSQVPGINDYGIGYHSSRYLASVYRGFIQPSNTNALTFTPYFRSEDGNTVRFIHGASSYCLKLTEIAA